MMIFTFSGVVERQSLMIATTETSLNKLMFIMMIRIQFSIIYTKKKS
jgi:hypothetical protein